MSISITTKEPHEIQEVLDFAHAKAMIEEFRRNNPQFFQIYDALVEDYNQKREAADKAVRAAEVRCGDWDLYQRYAKVNPQKVYESVGRETFLEAGGTIINKREYKMDARMFELAVTRGLVPKEVVEACTTVESKYHAPPAAVIL